MSGLCARLQDVDEAGAYRLNCPLDELHAAAEHAGFALFEANMATVHGKGEFLAALAQAIRAPEWFGHNWDALADALEDLTWQPAPGYVLVLRNGGGTLGLETEDYVTVSEILACTVSFWKSGGTPFWVFFC